MRGVLYLVLHPKRLLTLIGALVVGGLYVWVAAVGAIPGVRLRKAAYREAWSRRDRERRSAT